MPKRPLPHSVKFYMGIDPGRNGGIVVIGSDGSLHFAKMPRSNQGILSLFKSFPVHRTTAVIEQIHSIPGTHGSGMFNFGMGYGGLLMALDAVGITYTSVTAKVWQKALDISKPKGFKKIEWKNYLKEQAQALTTHRVTLWSADALLLATYCFRKVKGGL